MSTKKCAPDCFKAQERRRHAHRSSVNTEQYYLPDNSRSPTNSNYDFEISDATEYQSLPGKKNSALSHGDLSSREYIDDKVTPSQSVEESLDESSMCLSGCDYLTHRGQTGNYRYNGSSKFRRDNIKFSRNNETNSRSRSAATEKRKYKKISTGNFHDQASSSKKSRHQSYYNSDCSSSKSTLCNKKQRKNTLERSSFYSDIQPELSESESISCPELCHHDILRIPPSKKNCELSCPKRAWLDKQREKNQVQIDRYILNKGLNYFQDLCHCSLKCLATQIYMDPFVKKTAASAIFFFLGMKLCFEVDSWYIPF